MMLRGRLTRSGTVVSLQKIRNKASVPPEKYDMVDMIANMTYNHHT